MNDKEIRHDRFNRAMAQQLASQTTIMRMFKGWSQEELAEKAGVSLRTVRLVETARFEGNPQLLAKIASAFDVAIEVRFESWNKQIPESYEETLLRYRSEGEGG